MRILITGASGLIWQEVAEQARTLGHDVATLQRHDSPQTQWQWNPTQGLIDPRVVEWADAIISLNGAPLARLPWTDSYRQTIRASRVQPTQTLARAIAESDHPPHVWVSGSAVGFYGSRPGEELDEDSARGEGFLSDVVVDWESATSQATDHTRLVIARTGVVLSQQGALKPLCWQTLCGLGGWFGTGQQHWPWVTSVDEARAILFAVTQESVIGPINITAPGGDTMREVATALGQHLNRPVWLPIPGKVMRIALRDAAEDLLLADQYVIPQRLLEAGFTFQYPHLAQAVAQGL